MISDFVKGKKKADYSPGIQTGIQLHRFIDSFTDNHPATREAKEIFRPAYRLYGGPIMDVLYDHFLATDENEFTQETLLAFSLVTYQRLDPYIRIMPPQFAGMYPFMKTQNWLYGYRERTGILHSLNGLARRAVYLTETNTAFSLFERHYQLLRDCYRHFWAESKPAISEKFHAFRNGTGLTK